MGAPAGPETAAPQPDPARSQDSGDSTDLSRRCWRKSRSVAPSAREVAACLRFSTQLPTVTEACMYHGDSLQAPATGSVPARKGKARRSGASWRLPGCSARDRPGSSPERERIQHQLIRSVSLPGWNWRHTRRIIRELARAPRCREQMRSLEPDPAPCTTGLAEEKRPTRSSATCCACGFRT